MNAETPFDPGVSGSVRAKSSTVPPKPPFVIHCLAPEILQPSPSSTAAVRSEPGVRAGLGLGQREGPDRLAARERRHKPAALLVGAEGEDRQRHRARVHGNRHPHARVRARELLEHEHVREEVRARSALLLGNADAEQTKGAELPQQLARKAVRAIPRSSVRRDLGLGELPRQRLDLALVAREAELHRAASIVGHGLPSGTASATLPWSWYSDPQMLPQEQERSGPLAFEALA